MALTKQKADFIVLLERSLGILSSAIEAAGITRARYANWYNTDEEFSKRIDSITEKQIDFVESKLLEKINKGDTSAITFYLKTKGKDRGYTEKQVMEDKEVIININSLGPVVAPPVIDIPAIEPPAEKPIITKIRKEMQDPESLNLPDLPLYDEDTNKEESDGEHKPEQ